MTDESWHKINRTDKMIAWIELWSAEIVVIAKPQGYDYWNIYDTTDRVVEGNSLGPFRDHHDAKERVMEGIPVIAE